MSYNSDDENDNADENDANAENEENDWAELAPETIEAGLSFCGALQWLDDG